MDHRINIKIKKEKREEYKICAKMLGLDLTKMTIKAIDKYIEENIRGNEDRLKIEINRLKNELKQKEELLKINITNKLS